MSDIITPTRPKAPLEQRDREKLDVFRVKDEKSTTWYSNTTWVYMTVFAIVLAATVMVFVSTTPERMAATLPDMSTTTPAAGTAAQPLPTQRAF